MTGPRITTDDAIRLVRRLFDGEPLDGEPRDGKPREDEARPTRTLLAVGAPRCGKTTFALKALREAIGEFGDERSVMVVSDRLRADALNRRVIADLGATSQVRPVTTLSALAFRMIALERSHAGQPMPKLLNGAEQDALLRSVLAVHVDHVRAGDQCDTCHLLMRYFAEPDWARLVVAPSAMATVESDGPAESDAIANPDGAGAGATSEAVLIRGISAEFVSQLRDMLARMNELGASRGKEEAIIGSLADAGDSGRSGERVERLAAQWRLAFALRAEYIEAIGRAYPDEFRLDSSRLLVEGSRSVDALTDDELPRAVIVDDAQDMTLAGMAFLQRLASRECVLVMTGNPDEAVQAFRGSYPEFLFLRIPTAPASQTPESVVSPESAGPSESVNDRDLGRLAGMVVTLVPTPEGHKDGQETGEEAEACVREDTYLGLLSARVSLGISSVEDDPTPLPQRPGKLTMMPGAAPIVPLSETDPRLHDGTVGSALYRSAAEEMDDVVWHIKRARIVDGDRWNDLALIAHDNATVRVFGERLRREGVPVRYSSVTRPLKDEPFVRGLFALIELALMRREGIEGWRSDPRDAAAKVRSCALTALRSPLFTVGATDRHDGRPVRVSSVGAALQALESLAQVTGESAAGEQAVRENAADTSADSSEPAVQQSADTGAKGLSALVAAWDGVYRQWRSAEAKAHDMAAGANGLTIDDSLVGGVSGAPAPEATPALDVESLYLLLSLGGERAGLVLHAVQSVCGSHGDWRDPDARSFERLWQAVQAIADEIHALPAISSGTAAGSQYVLWAAWQACDVAARWQRMALIDGEEGREANDRLDAAMRLFQFAEGAGGSEAIGAEGSDGSRVRGSVEHGIRDFMSRVRSLQIEADSLAHVGPVEDAVSLTTPAGAAGRSWKRVWLPAMQQGVWPNLAARNTMFGAESLADVMLRGRLDGAGAGPSAGPHRSSTVMPVLAAEKKGLLVALTRAARSVYLSAVLDDDHTPSDFLYGFLPERFSYESADYAEVGQSGEYSGLELSMRGLVTAARRTLAAGAAQRIDEPTASGEDVAISKDTMISEAAMSDAAETLAYLADRGQTEADPRNWPFLYDDGEPDGDDIEPTTEPAVPGGAVVANPEPVTSTTVTLSPSAVDGIWACPVCWMMENRFAGPRSSSVVSGFGTIIHEVARRASEEGLDLPEYQADQPAEIRVELITARMMEIYQELRIDPSGVPGVPDRYAASRKDESAQEALRNIARYFVHSNERGYARFPSASVDVGRLIAARCELPFLARFGFEDILRDYNAIPGREPVEAGELYALMGLLVGGWPDGMSPDLTIRLTGRIDREEIRETEHGRIIRLIDYKTGRERTALQGFSDLQLVCYQMGLRYHAGGQSGGPANGRVNGPDGGVVAVDGGRATMTPVAQSGLFFVASRPDPSHYSAPEGSYQPALFSGGRITDEPFHPRYKVKELSRLFEEPPLPEERPEVIGEKAWERFLGERGGQTMWSLTMIARVLYAAGALRSETLLAHPDPEHVKFCRMRHCCPACAGEVRSVMEVNA
ncbi:PD-(D/E)XK nuclease family protein [Bifidobacterium simiarum]|uniref:PD-(D/E)XK nuclease family protein n=1 Tax=Bifidobacterium simiarum TaxID=2045441 RepID=UPI001BDC900D|nr:PD-(D/E)XK nuclease family protein [Bifidobacterium simiarum]MBT1166110.1 PD-(D/E)XK nuclease family protein [Bifidobacterium simiarum]